MNVIDKASEYVDSLARLVESFGRLFKALLKAGVAAILLSLASVFVYIVVLMWKGEPIATVWLGKASTTTQQIEQQTRGGREAAKKLGRDAQDLHKTITP